MKLDILFLGRLFPRQYEKAIKAGMKSGMADAANALQWNVIDGLEANECGKLRICNYLPVGSFPSSYKDAYIREYHFGHSKCDNDDINVGHLNIAVIKQFTNIIPYKRKIKLWAKEKAKENGKKILFLYSAQPLSLALAQYAKGMDSEIETVCMIADLPEFNTVSEQTGIRKAFESHESKKCAQLFQYIDKFILLTPQMATKLNIKVPFIVVEGIATDGNAEVDNTMAEKYTGQKYILYTGVLAKKFGISVLLEAFAKIKDDDLKLLICGCGEAEDMIRNSKDKRVSFLGRIDRKQVIALQRNATILVNPRQNNEEFTKYSFPSKTMEYLAAGVPVVAYKLDGIPDEYDNYLNYVNGDMADDLAKAIWDVCKKTEIERKIIGARAREFVLREKNSTKQAKRILDFLEQN